MNDERILNFWQAHPVLRLLLPFMGGIILADSGMGFQELSYTSLLLGLLLVWVAMLVTCFLFSWRLRYLFGLLSALFWGMAGVAVCSYQWSQIAFTWPDRAYIYEGKLIDDVSEKPRSYLCPVQLQARIEDESVHPMDNAILLYLPKDEIAASLKPGNVLYFYGQIKVPENFSDEFDYVRYLYHRKVDGILYTHHWKVASIEPGGLKAGALRMRDNLLAYYSHSGMTGDELAILSALTLGYKEELSEEVRERFNVSGASHLLALSGLHIGIICMFLLSCISVLLPGTRFFHLRRLLVIPIVWMFVLLVGSPLSAVRAAIMFSLLVVGNTFTRVGFSLNTLALAALGMLLYQPFYLFDVGFQMSFMAVASILLLQPWLSGLVARPRNIVLRYLWDITTVSVSAQIGVLPLVIYYFSRISPYALLVNLWVVPLTFVIVAFSLLFLLSALTPWVGIQKGMAFILEKLVTLMHEGLSLCNRLPGADVGNLHISLIELCCLYGLLFFASYGLMHKKPRCLICVLAFLCALVWLRCLAV